MQIWIQPEEPINLPFANPRDVYLYNIFAICHLNWTLFVLEAAPSLKNLYIMVSYYTMHPLFFQSISIL
jgi:hypothetical protein